MGETIEPVATFSVQTVTQQHQMIRDPIYRAPGHFSIPSLGGNAPYLTTINCSLILV